MLSLEFCRVSLRGLCPAVLTTRPPRIRPKSFREIWECAVIVSCGSGAGSLGATAPAAGRTLGGARRSDRVKEKLLLVCLEGQAAAALGSSPRPAWPLPCDAARVAWLLLFLARAGT